MASPVTQVSWHISFGVVFFSWLICSEGNVHLLEAVVLMDTAQCLFCPASCSSHCPINSGFRTCPLAQLCASNAKTDWSSGEEIERMINREIPSWDYCTVTWCDEGQ